MSAFLNTAFAGWLKVFLSAVLGIVLTNLSTGQTILTLNWIQVLTGAAASLLPVIINWLNPKDPRYGIGKTTMIVEKPSQN